MANVIILLPKILLRFLLRLKIVLGQAQPKHPDEFKLVEILKEKKKKIKKKKLVIKKKK